MNLRTDPIPQLIRQLAIPASLGMMFSVLLNVIDTYYAGLLSPTALAALSLGGPAFFIMITLGIGVSQACNALVGARLGASKTDEARRLAMQCLSYAAVVSAIASIVAFIFTPEFFVLIGGEDPYLQPAITYMRVVMLGTVLFSLSIVLNSILNTQGDTTSYRNSQIVAVLANVVLDPFFMFTLDMGVAGVAVATVILQAGVVVYMGRKVAKLEFMKSPRLSEFVPNLKLYKEITVQALPASASMMLVAVGGVIIVAFVTKFGEPSMAAYGAALRIEQLILLLIIGLNIAALSITGVNYGANQMDRVLEVYKTAMGYGFVLMVVGGVALLLFAEQLMSIFSSDEQVKQIGITYLYYEAFIFPAYAVTFLSAAVLQGIQQPRISMYFNIVRQVVGQLVLFYIAITVLEMEITGIWGSVLLLNWVLAVGIVYVTNQRLKVGRSNADGLV